MNRTQREFDLPYRIDLPGESIIPSSITGFSFEKFEEGNLADGCVMIIFFEGLCSFVTFVSLY